MKKMIGLTLLAFVFWTNMIASKTIIPFYFQPDSSKEALISDALTNDLIEMNAKKDFDVNTLNILLQNILSGDSKILNGLDLKFNSQQFEDNNFLGLNYSYKKNASKIFPQANSLNLSGLDFSLATEGNLILGGKENPNDFLKSKISFHYFNNICGIKKIPDEIKKEVKTWKDKLLETDNLDELVNSEEYKYFIEASSKFLKTQLYIDLSLCGSIESDHLFTKKQVLYGAQFAVDIKAWNVYSELAKLNIFDWPFAALRYLNGTDKELMPMGATIPTLLFNISAVDPIKDDVRKALGEKGVFPRFGFETAFRTVVSDFGGNRMYFSADFRYFKEINAKDNIKKQKLDEFVYFVAALTLNDGIYVSYANGSLPFDKKKDEVYSLGYNFKL